MDELSASESLLNTHSNDIIRNVAIAFTVLESVAVALRFISLHLTEKKFGIDDFLTIPGYFCCLGLIIISFGIVLLSMLKLQSIATTIMSSNSTILH